jgi:hypothetical protein
MVMEGTPTTTTGSRGLFGGLLRDCGWFWYMAGHALES